MAKSTFPGGVFPRGGKSLTKDKPVKELLPKGEMVYPLLQHAGTPAVPVVRPGDKVLTGQLIADAASVMSAPVYATVSGRVKAVEMRKCADGAMCESIVVENDGLYDEAKRLPVRPYDDMSPQDKIDALHMAGVVGMGGGGFPTALKYVPREPDKIEYVIANCVECEPYLTCDYRCLAEEPEVLLGGLKIALSLFPNAQGLIALSEYQADLAKRVERLLRDEEKIGFRIFPATYPQGHERMLVHACTGRRIGAMMQPADAGCIISNAATLRAVYHAVGEGIPLMERIVTVSGDAVRQPGNYRVRVGTSFRELLEDAGGLKDESAILLAGGTMTGFLLEDTDVPVTKTTAALTCLLRREAEAEEGACIRCGACAEVCPVRLLPVKLAEAAEYGKEERFLRLYGTECIGCGCCTYICPARRRLTERIGQMRETLRAGGAA